MVLGTGWAGRVGEMVHKVFRCGAWDVSCSVPVSLILVLQLPGCRQLAMTE